MVAISEWLPNPAGNDTEGEWVELWNPGNMRQDLSGWKLVSGKSSFSLRGSIGSGEYLVLKRQDTKLSLPNQNGSLQLIAEKGILADSAGFTVTAPEGKSYQRTSGGNFFFALPTPGAPNSVAGTAMLHSRYGNLSFPPSGTANLLILAIGFGVMFSAALLFIIRSDGYFSKLIFGGDEAVR